MTEAASFVVDRFADPQSGLEVLSLQSPPNLVGGPWVARLAPEVGANLFSLRVGDDELLSQPPSLRDLPLGSWGTPILFPWPNRVRDATFVFEGQRFQLHANYGAEAIHGLVRALAFQVTATSATVERATATLSLDWNDSQAEFSCFPLEHRLTVSYALDRQGVTISYTVENRSRQRLPFGFGLHPWFRVPGAREEVVLQVPAAERMEAKGELPTGALLPVAGTPFDLREGVGLAGLDLDTVYFGVVPEHPAGFQLRDRDLRITLGGTADFAYVVVYTPQHRPVFCIENQTSSTDAHNLYDRHLVRESGLRIVAPGESAQGAVTWTISHLARR